MYKCMAWDFSFLQHFFVCIACMPVLLARNDALGVEKLRWGKYSLAYKKRLLEGCRRLHEYLLSAGLSWNVILKHKASVVDGIVEQYIRAMHEHSDKSSLRVAKHGLLAVQIMRPRLHRKLQASWNAIKAWEELQPSSFRPPLPLTLLMAMVCRAMLNSENCESRKEGELWKAFGAMLLTGFFGLLRPGELFGLRSADAVMPNSWSLGGDFAVVRVARPKNSRQMGSQQYVEIRHPDAVNWLSWLKNVRNNDAALWNSTPNKFRVMFRRVCKDLKLHSLHLSPASLRAGGATWLVDEGVEISRVRFLGRWSHLRSLEHYIQVARAQQITLSLSSVIALQLKEFLARFHFLVHLPAFLAERVPAESLLIVPPLDDFPASHAIIRARAWGRLSQAVPQSGGERRAFEGR